MLVALIVASVLVGTTNACVIGMVIFIKELRTFTNYFVVSLAMSDLLTGWVFLPLHITHPNSSVTGFATMFILYAGVLTLCAVTWERYVATIEPFQYREKLKKYQKKVLVVIWLIPLLTTLVPLGWEVDRRSVAHRWFINVTLLVLVIVPYFLIFVAYVRIWLRLRSHASNMRRMDMTIEQREGARRASLESKTVKVFLVVVSVFLVSWLPVIYMTTIIYAFRRPDLIPKHLVVISLYTVALSSLINPILYAFLKRDFASQFRRLRNSRMVPRQITCITPSMDMEEAT